MELILLPLSSIFAFVIYKFSKWIIRKYFNNQVTWIIQNTIFHSPMGLKICIYLFIFLLIFSGIYCAYFVNYLMIFLSFFGVSLSCILFYFKKKGTITISDDKIYFEKHSTSVSYYNQQSKKDKLKSYHTLINMLKHIDFNQFKDEDLKKHLVKNIIPKLDSLFDFFYYDLKLENSKSEYSTGMLFYNKFLKSFLEAISRIIRQTNNLDLVNNNYQQIDNIILDIRLLRFSDSEGLHYDIELLDSRIDDLFIQSNKSLEINNIIFKDKAIPPSKYKLPKGGILVSDITNKIVDYFQGFYKINLEDLNKSDIKVFSQKWFENGANRQGNKILEYKDKTFFYNNRDIFIKILSKIIKDFKQDGIEKIKIAKIIAYEFPEFNLDINTIKNRL